tara:strand:+ start:31 stop:282 length:252 start_codon:yes stop_codon:yes gene_type:complete
MRNTYENILATLTRFSVLDRANAEGTTASEAAGLLEARDITKANGRDYTAHDIRQWRSTNKDMTEAERKALRQAHWFLLGSES